MINFNAFLNMLPYLLLGMLGIFTVVLVIICVTYGLTILSTLIERRARKKNR